MADEEHLKILKQGVEVWNRWREENHDTKPEFSLASFPGADLSGADLSGANLRRVHLTGAHLSGANLSAAELHGARFSLANLSEANLISAYLGWAHLSGTNLHYADLSWAYFGDADLTEANLTKANLSRAYLREADLTEANLTKANLSGADLIGAKLAYANLFQANLFAADLRKAHIGWTALGDVDLSTAKGLETVGHYGPSTVGIDTLRRSQGNIPEAFLRGCGLSDWEIESAKLYRPGLSGEEFTNIYYRVHDLRVHRAIQINPLFISYSHADGPFVDCMEHFLNKKGIRFWRDVHHATAGPLEEQIDRAIRLNPTVLLILSTHSVKSDWVQHEAREARNV